nr:immunoglobulin light chain junction region [Macaca mulatta]MOV77573.1 immunoglobulin light chain junction region [Macaca mulatta]MOV77581.1 immunoglobulin light chain junction region [Macaca mulatta]MOV77589.1 immunoglobulin light chain junction region [Macaca mulatta]MOV77594.1 immunoglobulin light chain junction region [Macaca mulatta]
CQQYDSDSLTF